MDAPEPGWFNPIAAYLGADYLRHAFTKGTYQEIDFLVQELDLVPGATVLDVGCGPGRHSLELARRGYSVVGVDLSPEFVAIATARASDEGLDARFEVLDVRDLSFDRGFDAVVCLCQGGFGLLGGADDEAVLGRMAIAARPGGRLGVSAFSTVFAVRELGAQESFDPSTGVLHEHTQVVGPGGEVRAFELWTTCFTARELRLLATRAGLEVLAVHGVTPGRYRAAPPTVDDAELLLVARRP